MDRRCKYNTINVVAALCTKAENCRIFQMCLTALWIVNGKCKCKSIVTEATCNLWTDDAMFVLHVLAESLWTDGTYNFNICVIGDSCNSLNG
jgi:hypothetical protein